MSFFHKLLGLPNGKLKEAQDRLDAANADRERIVASIEKRAASIIGDNNAGKYMRLRLDLDRLRTKEDSFADTRADN